MEMFGVLEHSEYVYCILNLTWFWRVHDYYGVLLDILHLKATLKWWGYCCFGHADQDIVATSFFMYQYPES